MGIKENFTQAVKELTGGKDKDADRKSLPVEELKKAVEADSVRQAREITLGGDDVPEATPASEAFFAGGEIPSSSFASNVRPYKPEASDGTGFSRSEFNVTAASAESAESPSDAGSVQSGEVFAEGKPAESPLFNLPAPTPMPELRTGRDEENEITIISRNTVVDGNIRSFADMSVDGDIKGDVETTKNIDLNGKIIGNITCNNALMHASQVQGNIRMKGNVSMRRDTLLIGDLMSTYAEVNGKVKGNLDVVGKADLKGDAVVFGDISASTITVEDGAIIQGYVSTTFLNKEESKNLFPESIIIGDSGG